MKKCLFGVMGKLVLFQMGLNPLKTFRKITETNLERKAGSLVRIL